MEELNVKFVSPRGKTSKHVIYCKKHSLRKNSGVTPNSRTLFSVGWPSYCDEDDVKELLSRTSEVERVFLRATPGNVEETEDKSTPVPFTRRDFGYVVFKTAEGLTQMLTLCKSKTTLSCPITKTGVSVLLKDYTSRRPSEAVLESMAKKEVEKYDSWMEDEKKRKRLLSEPDEEGWVTVTKKAPVIEPGERPTTSKSKKKKQQYHLKLYPFQMRETQREKLAELRKKFEEDKKRVAAMKAQRKFKPF